MNEEFEPTIIAFFCNWCTYTAADLAGTSRLSYPPNVKIIRVMCSGMVDPKYVIKALLDGADGVLISGCNPGDCHYINGNFKARRRIKLLKEILPRFGFETERLRLTWIAASDGVLLAETLQELVAQIKALGPSQAKLQEVG
jgi:coenzyme F420-reducing hydrogenase delta subunit